MAGDNPYVIVRDGQSYVTQPVQLVGPDGMALGSADNPLSIAGGAAGGPTGPLDVSDRAARILGQASVNNWPAVQSVSGAFLTDAQLRATPVPTSVTNFPATQPVSGPLTDTQLRGSAVPVQDKTANTLGVSVTAAAGVAVTATLPAPPASQYQFIELIEITLYATAARTGGATPVVVSSTNLPAAHAWTFPTAGAIGTTVTYIVQPTHPIRAASPNTAVTIVCPATASVIWRLNVSYRNDSP